MLQFIRLSDKYFMKRRIDNFGERQEYILSGGQGRLCDTQRQCQFGLAADLSGVIEHALIQIQVARTLHQMGEGRVPGGVRIPTADCLENLSMLIDI